MTLTPITMWGKYGDFLYLFNKGGNYKDDEEKELENFDLYGGKYHELEKDKNKNENLKNCLRMNNIEGDFGLYMLKKGFRPSSLYQEPALAIMEIYYDKISD